MKRRNGSLGYTAYLPPKSCVVLAFSYPQQFHLGIFMELDYMSSEVFSDFLYPVQSKGLCASFSFFF